ncbi:hypothetical protein JAAARDRAFT_69398 [Jaapia argillacea MUCL 33604]|uniref:Uncharacterized protein n=1 Tax=Jaapia argillacea MUCL 33604 TaxID=933084 RepID=A0A067PTH5_9AGAM|nr:hypothetical protein JAAARDRAFT_69398 [Jaapia argillacea MUCL 33604]
MCQESCEGETRNHRCCRTSPETVHCTAVDPPSLHNQPHKAYHVWRETAVYQNIGQSRVRRIANGKTHHYLDVIVADWILDADFPLLQIDIV